jgi:hypothetical protein
MFLSSAFDPGKVVEVLSEAQILSTLDKKGTLEGLLFAPEMRELCGKRFRVLRRLNNIMIEDVGMRQIRDAVILDGATCNGEYNMGCSRMCHLIWKMKWLKPIQPPQRMDRKIDQTAIAGGRIVDVFRNDAFSCQATSLLRGSSPPDRSLIRQYLLSIDLGALGPIGLVHELLTSLSIRGLRLLQRRWRIIVVGENTRTPTASLGFQLGELVEVRSIEEIRRTLDRQGRNRGLVFSLEMLQYCHKRFKVLKRVDKAINEATGKIRGVSNTVVLEGVECDGKAHGFCQRRCPCLWREIWLRKVPAATAKTEHI